MPMTITGFPDSTFPGRSDDARMARNLSRRKVRLAVSGLIEEKGQDSATSKSPMDSAGKRRRKKGLVE